MNITVVSRTNITSFSLPERVAGKYWLETKLDGQSFRFFSIEAMNEAWCIKLSDGEAFFVGLDKSIKNVKLELMSVIPISYKDNDFFVFPEPVTQDRERFSKFIVHNNFVFTIGRDETNDILFNSSYVSSRHTELSYVNKTWKVRDLGSTNGTFVNENRVKEEVLNYGDVVYVMGLKLIVGKKFLAMNNPDHRVSITNSFEKYVDQLIIPVSDDYEYECPEKKHFYRLPRFKRDIEVIEYNIDSPPASPVTEELPIIMVMGTSMAMGMMSMVTLTNAVINKNFMSGVMGGAMLMGIIVMPTISRKYTAKLHRKKEALRQKKYRKYLSDFSVRFAEDCMIQEEILRENFPAIQECENRIIECKNNLWEREHGQNDFLRFRVGVGECEEYSHLTSAERKFSLDDDILLEELYELSDEPRLLKNVPITYSLYDDNVSSYIGKRDDVIGFAKGIIFQVLSYYAYDEVKLVFLFDKEEEDVFEFAKWLPHVWSDDGSIRFIGTNMNEVKEISSYLENELENRKQINESIIKDMIPYYIIFSASKNLALRADVINRIFASKKNLGFSVVTLYDDIESLPKDSTMVVEIDGPEGRLFDKNDISGSFKDFLPDIRLSNDPLLLSEKLANISLETSSGVANLPEVITFLEMFGVGKVEHLNSLVRWKENDPSASLETPIGVNTIGDTFMLDLHEKKHGPHGLVAGMTGSGKSEFIIAYILSLAINYHPYEVAFILIDYKGGGMAKSFEHLPHTAGIITNLDGSAIKRSLVSIESELKRRQMIFSEVSKKVNISNIDIYKYQKLYREGTVSEPLQHLFIISDEFAELKTQQSEFMTQLVSAARIGRSLGVHLILATQKPSGVVDDQIWSNSRFRICLKVQERADSNDMLKRPDAAELKNTGRFYLQVGYNELFDLGQSAWAGAPYYPSDRVIKEKDESVEVVDNNGRVISRTKLDKRKAMFGEAPKQLDVITSYLMKVAEDENIKIRPLWLDPIPGYINIEEIKKKYNVRIEPYNIEPVIGEYDAPALQKQCVFRLPISNEGNVIIYGSAGNGKTTFLNAMIYSLITEHTPEEVSLYILDFASETLKAFERAPHVGDVVLSYEKEKIYNMIKLLYKQLKDRKKIFSNYGGDYKSYIGSANDRIPSIVVTINNYTAFIEEYSDLEEDIILLTREGVKYGIYFVLTSASISGIRFKMLQNFKTLLTMRLNDEADYTTVVGKTEGLFPAKFKGRGLLKRDMIYEFQTASLCEDAVPFSFIKAYSEKLRSSWSGKIAENIPVLPDVVDAEFLSKYIVNREKVSNIPIGVECNSLKIHNYFDNLFLNLVVSSGDEYKGFADELFSFISREYSVEGCILNINGDATSSSKIKSATSIKECEELIDSLFEMAVYRNNTYKEALEKNIKCEEFADYIILINSFSSLRNALSDQSKEKLNLVIEKGQKEYNYFFVLADSVKGFSRVMPEKWYKKHATNVDGIWIGNGITEQYVVKPSSLTRELRQDIKRGFGISVKGGKTTVIKLLCDNLEVDDEG